MSTRYYVETLVERAYPGDSWSRNPDDVRSVHVVLDRNDTVGQLPDCGRFGSRRAASAEAARLNRELRLALTA